ncbi:DUF7933 domain-containing protein [Streptomyces sp. NBC_01334]|uniref:DUF7933 domain-containing protein n=1 Tax=Streptomyces sp. NBC_01334 TaxID=2903827 RepID=UPI002E139CC1|nr:hypothetical protein OG736_43270 [Streptomyces sp. NBC_01334]
MSALCTVVGLGVALPFALSATPAHAQPILGVDKSHAGNFARGGQGVYTITVSNSGDEPATPLELTDNLPTGLTVADIQGDLASACEATNSGTTLHCDGFGLADDASTTFEVTVDVAADAPCSVANTVTVTQGGGATVSDSDQTTITGGDCDGGNGGGGGSILPINLNGLIPMFNNITTNNNINSPGASNNSRQTYRLNAP